MLYYEWRNKFPVTVASSSEILSSRLFSGGIYVGPDQRRFLLVPYHDLAVTSSLRHDRLSPTPANGVTNQKRASFGAQYPAFFYSFSISRGMYGKREEEDDNRDLHQLRMMILSVSSSPDSTMVFWETHTSHHTTTTTTTYIDRYEGMIWV